MKIYSKAELKRLCTQNPVGMAFFIHELEDEYLRLQLKYAELQDIYLNSLQKDSKNETI